LHGGGGWLCGAFGIVLCSNADATPNHGDEGNAMRPDLEDGDAAGAGDLMARSDARWYAAATLPRQEALAAENLRAQSFDFFLPRMRVTKRHARRVIQAVDPVFPGYVFVRMDVEATAWRCINGTRGIRQLVMGGERPLPARAGVIETLIASVGDDGYVKFTDPVRPGALVRLTNGPFAEALGEVLSLDGRGRVRLLLSMFGSAIKVETERKRLAAA
jgi:transcriptional antiterminator RfaH